jgi:hypothetical protein
MSLEGLYVEDVRVDNYGESTFVPTEVHHGSPNEEDAH